MIAVEPIASTDRVTRAGAEADEARLRDELLGLATAARQRRPWARSSAFAVAVMVVAGVALRFWSPSALWLDETISVNIAKLPLAQIPAALAHDGAPPLYYVLLHFWMLVFGQGDLAVRGLSGLVSLGAIPLLWKAGWRLGGRPVAWAAFVLGLTSPFAIQYATTARMYSMLVLLSVLGYLAFTRAVATPSRRNLFAVGGITAALLYTHYWALYLVGVTGLWLLWRIWRDGRGHPMGPGQRGVRPTFAAMVIGSLAWLPWSPVFVYQTLHTGTPWTGSAGPADLLGVFGDFGGPGPWGLLLAYALFALALLGVFGRAAPGSSPEGGHAVLLVTRPSPRLSGLSGVVVGTLVVAVVAGAVANAAFVARYAAVVLPLFLLIVAVGTSLFERRIAVAVLSVMAVAGLLTGLGEDGQARTQAVQVASVLDAQAQPGDLVVFCPDQLGPAVNRLLTVPDVTQLTFPKAIGPQRVDWVDYAATIDSTHIDLFAQEMLSRLGPGHTLWLVYKDGYPGLKGDCGQLRSWLDLLRPTGVTTVAASGHYYEPDNLVRYPS